jgi:hypothetical protein
MPERITPIVPSPRCGLEEIIQGVIRLSLGVIPHPLTEHLGNI